MAAAETRPPRLAVVVANGITGDSRVQKAAIAAARDGWDVTLVGRSAGKKREESSMGPIRVIRVPVLDHYRKYARQPTTHPVRRAVTQFGLPDRNALNRYRASHEAWRLQHLTRLAEGGAPARPARKAWLRARDYTFNLRQRAWGWENAQAASAPRQPTGDWRSELPQLVDVDIAFAKVINKLAPDVVHANDITMIGTVAQAVAQLRARGRRCAWLYDAHEYVRGVEWRLPEYGRAFPALEAEYIHSADAVVTVSPQIADLLRDDYQLPETPLVVRNTPIRETVGTQRAAPSVRQVAGLEPDVPLLVYSGWISAERGLGTAVAALATLPDYHLAIVAGTLNAEVEGLLQRADELGVRDRIHVVPYVAQHAVPDYLSSADLGLICSKRTLNYEISLPTKLAEYLHGGVPVVVSDVKTLSAFVREHGVGEVFTSDDPASLAEAVTRAMARRAELVQQIADPVLEDLSWEHQSAGLVQLYRRIAPRVPSVTRPDVPWTVQERPVSVAGTPSGDGGPPAMSRWRPLGPTRVKLGVGPANFAGQAAAYALAVSRADTDVSAEVFMYRAPQSFGFPADVHLDALKLRDVDLQVEQVKRIIGRFTHLLADGFRPVFGHLNGDHIGADLPALRTAGIKVALLAHGSEVRHPDRHRERHEYSLFRDAPAGMAEKLIAQAVRNRRIAEESGLPLFVTTPDLLDDLPWAKWTPLVIDVDGWACDRPVMERPRPIVCHAPSARWTKGTERIMPALTDLHDRGVIELRLAEKVAWEEMRQLVQTSDIVVDQFATGSYGTLACEAMAAGKPVVAYIGETVERTIGSDLPIVNATPATIGAVLEALVEDRDGTAKLGLRSAEFARTYHGGAWTARVLADFLR